MLPAALPLRNPSVMLLHQRRASHEVRWCVEEDTAARRSSSVHVRVEARSPSSSVSTISRDQYAVTCQDTRTGEGLAPNRMKHALTFARFTSAEISSPSTIPSTFSPTKLPTRCPLQTPQSTG
eukprot:1761783-Rhodomonas_salina.2